MYSVSDLVGLHNSTLLPKVETVHKLYYSHTNGECEVCDEPLIAVSQLVFFFSFFFFRTAFPTQKCVVCVSPSKSCSNSVKTRLNARNVHLYFTSKYMYTHFYNNYCLTLDISTGAVSLFATTVQSVLRTENHDLALCFIKF